MRDHLLLLCVYSVFSLVSSEEPKDNFAKAAITRARLEVKAFIRELLPHYHDVNIRYIPGKDPTMVFLNAQNKVVLEEDVAEKKTEEISQLLEKHGLMRSAEARSEVPEDDELDEPWESEEDTEEPEEQDDDEEEDDDDAAEHIEL